MRFARTAAVVSVVALACMLGVASVAVAAPKAAWKVLAATGPTNIPPRQSEVQKVTVEAEGGEFELGYPEKAEELEGMGTPLVHEAHLGFTSGSAVATIESVEAGAAFEVGDRVTLAGAYEFGVERIVVSCSTDCATPGTTVTLSQPATAEATDAAVHIFTRELDGVTAAWQVGEEVQGVDFEYFPAGTVITEIEGEMVTLSHPTSFEYLSREGAIAVAARRPQPAEMSTPLKYDATPQEVQVALEGLPRFGPGSLSVAGGPGGDAAHPYFVTFDGPGLASQDVEQLTADGSALTEADGHQSAYVSTALPGGNGTGEIAVFPSNVGGLATSGTITVEVGPLPPGILTAGQAHSGGTTSAWTCTGGAGEETATCTTDKSFGAAGTAFPGNSTSIVVPIEVESADAFESSAPVTVSGAGGGTDTVQVPIMVSNVEAQPGVQVFWAGAFDAEGKPSTQAGGHPAAAVADLAFNTVRSPSGGIVPPADPKEVDVDLPPGFIGNPLVTPRCPQDQIVGSFAGQADPICGPQDSIGVFGPSLGFFGAEFLGLTPTFNDVPAFGTAAQFTTSLGGPLQSVLGSVRSSEDFGVRIAAPHITLLNKLYGAFTALAGSPAGAGGKAFLTNPTDCSVQREESARGEGPDTRVTLTTWQPNPTSSNQDPLPLLTGCQAVTEAWLGHGAQPQNEEPSFSFQPSTTQASSPAGATADLHVPQAGLTDPNKLATSHLKKTVVTLPNGVSVNPSSAKGLEACSETQIGYRGSVFLSPNPMRFDENPVTCPDASKLGIFRIKTPLLEEEVEGTIYLAAQDQNPFHSLIALYLVVENERFGLILKLPGEVRPDPATGQLTATFDNNPQLPFEDLTLHFRGGGGRATLATPETCGHFETTGSLEPWSAEHGEALPIHEAGFSTEGPCASSEATRPFAPAFEAGTTGTQAGSYSPLVIKVSRRDGEQELKSLDFTLPKGLTGKLAGIPYCPEAAISEAERESGEAELAAPSCPAASQIGAVDTAAGVGDEPIHVGGKVYLAGPYKGAPLSSVVITPAVAGPFDLGDVVVRAPLFVNPETAEITAKSDPIPTILKGIRLKVRSVAINLDRSDFTLNPTSCEPMTVSASLGSSDGATASPTNRFQVGGCKQLKFKPKLQLSVKGSTKRTGRPALKAVVTYPKAGAYANIRRAQVNLPHSEFLEQNSLNRTCTKPVLLEGKCPKSTIYGKAKAWTPLLEEPLAGPVYLVGGFGYKLPALVAELDGQIRVVLKGKVDSGPNKGIRNTFEAVPDAPVSRFVLEMRGGRKYGLLINSENLCKKPQRAVARFTAQNGKVLQTKPLIANQCGKPKKGKGMKSKAKHAQGTKH